MTDFFLKLYKIAPLNMKIEPAQRRRQWMNENTHVYKCGPVTNCNSFGWDILTVEDHLVEWNGGPRKEDLIIHEGQSTSHTNFGYGVLTFVPGFVWHTPNHWSLYVTSVPNEPNDLFWTIDALIETDILKYPFFPSVTLKKPGKYTIPKDTAICRVFPVKIPEILDCEPVIENEPKEFQEYRLWQAAEREAAKREQQINHKKIWQKFYHDRATYPVVRMKNVKNNIDSE